MPTENEILEEVNEIKESALKSPILKWIAVIASILTIGGVATVRNFKNEIVDMVCESQNQIIALEKDKQFSQTTVIQSMYLGACESTLICYTTASAIMGIDDSSCKTIYSNKKNDITVYIEKQNK